MRFGKPKYQPTMMVGDWPPIDARCATSNRPWSDCGCKVCVAARGRHRAAIKAATRKGK